MRNPEKQKTPASRRSASKNADLRSALHRIVDATLAAGDALALGEANALARAMVVLAGNVEIAQTLAATIDCRGGGTR